MKQSAKQDEYDLAYHIRPPKGLLNDPNGLIQYKGVYHVFYQWNQQDTTHQTKSWGHVSSKDLIHWETHPPALEPVDWFDRNGCYSGSAVEADGKLYLFYTGNVRGEDGSRTSYQCMAVSEDGVHFEKKGPLFEQPPGYTGHVRDPKVWQDAEGIWWMILGAQREDLSGDCIVYHSQNLIDWDYDGSLIVERPKLGYMWECPDLCLFAEKDIFVFSPQGMDVLGDEFQNFYQTGYITGQFKANGKFEWDKESVFKELDRGFEFYAPQTFIDDTGRRILLGWLGVMDPAVEAAVPTRKDGWLHALTFPREIIMEEGRLKQRPVKEIAQMRKPVSIASQASTTQTIVLPSLQSELQIQWKEAAEEMKLEIRKAVQIAYSSADQRLIVSRTNWLSKEIEERAVHLQNGLHSLQLLIESSLLELFINDGEEVFSLRYFVEDENEKNIKWAETAIDSRETTLYQLDL